MPQARTATSASPGPGVGSGTSSTTIRPAPGDRCTHKPILGPLDHPVKRTGHSAATPADPEQPPMSTDLAPDR